MIAQLKAFWQRLTAPEEFIGVTTDDRILGAVPAHQPVFPFQVWTARIAPDGSPSAGDVFIEALNTEEDSVTYCSTVDMSESKTQNRKMFLRHYQPAYPVSRYDPALGEVVPLLA